MASSASLAFFDLDLALLDSAALLDFGVAAAPLAVLGVELVVSLILGFFTESERCGVCQKVSKAPATIHHRHE